MRKAASTIVLTIAFACGAGVAVGQTYSRLWGTHGEAWSPEGRLPDFSYAGYHCGEAPLPRVDAVTDVTRFGAKGDGKTDCTEAFIKAIAATDNGAIRIPAGTYVISDIIWIQKPNIVLRGDGPGKTIIHVTAELEDVRPNMGATTGGRPTSNYSWSGGFIWVKGSIRHNRLAAITADAARGTRELILEEPVSVKAGEWVAVEVHDDASKSLLKHLYAGDAGNTDKITKPITLRFASRVVSVRGSRVILERPLRFDVRSAWNPVLTTFDPNVSEVGIEDLAITFPAKPYRGHFTERGMNGIALNGVANCWVRNVRIANADSGIYVGGTFCTVAGLVIESDRQDKGGATGHHGISFGTDCLVEQFDLRTHFIHDITLSNVQAGNVLKNGKGVNLSLDHHKRAPHDNLFCNLDVGTGSEIWRCGGGADLGKHSGARETFWCIRSQRDIRWPPASFGPDMMNLVGMRTGEPSILDPDGKWFEAIPPDELQPADLHAAQLARRLADQTP